MSNPITTVQEIYAAFGRGDLPGILSYLADDVVWITEGPEAVSLCGIRHGIPEATGFFSAIAQDHAEPKLTIDEFVASGDSVATVGRYQCTMKATGKKVSTPIAHHWRIKNGKVTRYEGFINSAAFTDALKA